MKKLYFILFIFLFPISIFSQNLNFNVGKTVGRGNHFVGIDFYNKFYESTLDYPLIGSKLDIGINFDVYRIVFNYIFEHGNYNGFIWSNDYELNILTDRMKAWNKTYSNFHMIRLGYMIKDDIVRIGLFLCQYWAKMEHNMTLGHVYISNYWPVDKRFSGLNSYYTNKSSCYGVGAIIDFWMIETEFNYFHNVKTKGTGWWNLRDMVFDVYNYADHYKGDIKVVFPLKRFFDVYLGYEFDVSYLIGDGFENNEVRISGTRVESVLQLDKNTKFFHGIGFGIKLKI